jgi:hypothetical protein
MAEKKPDGQVEGYERVVNGKVVVVNGYAKSKTSPAVDVQSRALAMPGRPRLNARPGTYASGRQVPGVEMPMPTKPTPPPVPMPTKPTPGDTPGMQQPKAPGNGDGKNPPKGGS